MNDQRERDLAETIEHCAAMIASALAKRPINLSGVIGWPMFAVGMYLWMGFWTLIVIGSILIMMAIDQ